jgi:hypothetical protein
MKTHPGESVMALTLLSAPLPDERRGGIELTGGGGVNDAGEASGGRGLLLLTAGAPSATVSIRDGGAALAAVVVEAVVGVVEEVDASSEDVVSPVRRPARMVRLKL